MDTFMRFFYDFLSQFFSGVIAIFSGIVDGFVKIFNIPEYIKIINFYKNDFSGPDWLFVVLAIILLLALLVGIGLLLYFLVRKIFRFRKTLVEQESLLEEVAELNKKVAIINLNSNII